MIKKGLMFILALVMVFSLVASAFAEPSYWEDKETGKIVIKAYEPTPMEKLHLKPHKHLYTEYKVIKEPTCSENGEQVRFCLKCNLKEVLQTAKLDHDYGDWTVTREPTCAYEGSKYRVCGVCGKIDIKPIPVLPHTLGEWEVVIEETDHSASVQRAVCQVCGAVETKYVDPAGTLRRGDFSQAVKDMQEMLAEQNYLEAKYVDGKFGLYTERAVKKFQSEIGITCDGVAWPETIRLLNHEWSDWEVVEEGDYYSFTIKERHCEECCLKETQEIGVMLSSGDRGENVKELQKALKKLHYDVFPDGEYGDLTRRAVRAYQEQHLKDYPADGICWPGVWNELFPNK